MAKLELKKRYETASKDQVECVHYDENKKLYACKYVKIVAAGHEVLKDKISFWREDGKWDKYPGGIHDITKEG